MPRKNPKQRHKVIELIYPHIVSSESFKRHLAYNVNPLWHHGGKCLLEAIYINYMRKRLKHLLSKDHNKSIRTSCQHLLEEKPSYWLEKPKDHLRAAAAGSKLLARTTASCRYKHRPSDRDVIFGTCFYVSCQYGWEKSRLEWLYELERQQQLQEALQKFSSRRHKTRHSMEMMKKRRRCCCSWLWYSFGLPQDSQCTDMTSYKRIEKCLKKTNKMKLARNQSLHFKLAMI